MYEGGDVHLETGRYCNPLTEFSVDATIHLRSSTFSQAHIDHILGSNTTETVEVPEIKGDFHSNPAKIRRLEIEKQKNRGIYRKRAVCTTLTFTNKFTGPLLYMFATYYDLMGWR